VKVSPLLNDSLAAARLAPDAFVRQFHMASSTYGCWTSDGNAAFGDGRQIRLRAYWRGDEIAADAVLADGAATVTTWDNGLALAKITRLRLPATVELTLPGQPIGQLIGPSILDRPEYVIRRFFRASDTRMLVLFDCASELLQGF